MFIKKEYPYNCNKNKHKIHLSDREIKTNRTVIIATFLAIKWIQHGVFLHKRNKRLNTGMAPTCDWMIKLVKVNKLYFNPLLLSIVNRVYQSGTMKYQCEWKHRCVQQEMVTYVAKGRQPFLFSEVVLRYSGDEKVICWLSLLTKLI